MLLINGSSRSEHTCPGEMSKTYRLCEIARDALVAQDMAVQLLDSPGWPRNLDARFTPAEELKGWPYPKHLAGRVFSGVVHGDVEGAENVRRSLADWLRFMDLSPAGVNAELDRYIGYWQPYALGHDALDRDTDVQAEVRNAALTLAEAAHANHAGTLLQAGQALRSSRKK